MFDDDRGGKGATFALAIPVVAALLCGCYPTPIDLEAVLTQTERSEHFVFHYAPGDGVDVARAEAFYAWISARLALDLDHPIQFYKFQNTEQKVSLTSDGGNARAYPDTNSVCTIWTWDNHEVTHLLTYRLGTAVALFNEGIAVANQVDPLDNSYTPYWSVLPLRDTARDLLGADEVPALASILDSDDFRAADANITYVVAGSFVEYLLEQYGVQTVLGLLPGASHHERPAAAAARFERVFGITLDTAEQAWRASLQGP
jgi:hypothetical protein